MQSRRPGDNLVESLTLDLSKLKLLRGGLAGSIGTLYTNQYTSSGKQIGKRAYSEGTSAPGGATANLGVIGKDVEGELVSEGNKVDAVVGQGADGSEGGGLLSSSLGAGGDEETGVLALEGTLLPKTASGVDEGLPLGGEVSETGGDTKEETVVVAEQVGSDDGVVGLGGGVHLGQDRLVKSLRDPF